MASVPLEETMMDEELDGLTRSQRNRALDELRGEPAERKRKRQQVPEPPQVAIPIKPVAPRQPVRYMVYLALAVVWAGLWAIPTFALIILFFPLGIIAGLIGALPGILIFKKMANHTLRHTSTRGTIPTSRSQEGDDVD